jgi:hypothetical protein
MSVKPNMHEDGVALPATFWDATSPLPWLDNIMAMAGEDPADERMPLILLKAAKAIKNAAAINKAATVASEQSHRPNQSCGYHVVGE